MNKGEWIVLFVIISTMCLPIVIFTADIKNPVNDDICMNLGFDRSESFLDKDLFGEYQCIKYTGIDKKTGDKEYCHMEISENKTFEEWCN